MAKNKRENLNHQVNCFELRKDKVFMGPDPRKEGLEQLKTRV